MRNESKMQIINIPVDQIDPNDENNTWNLDADSVESLRLSIEKVGLLNPLRIRKRDDGKLVLDGGRHRYRACVANGMKEIPCIMVDHSQSEKILNAASVAENLVRRVAKRREEVQIVADLVKKVGIDDACKTTGKKSDYVRMMVRLAECKNEQLMQAFYEGKISKQLTDIIGRIQDSKRVQQATKIALDDSMSYIEKRREIMRVMKIVDLRRSPFSMADDSLYGGACMYCPHLVGNMRKEGLFDENDDRGVPDEGCMNTDCCREKMEEAWKNATNKALQEGKKAIGEEAIYYFHPAHRTTLLENCGYIDLDAICPSDPEKRIWSNLLSHANYEKLQKYLARSPLLTHHCLAKEKEVIDLLCLQKSEVGLALRKANISKEKEEKQRIKKEEEARKALAVKRQQLIDSVDKADQNQLFRAVVVALVATLPQAEIQSLLTCCGVKVGAHGDTVASTAKCPDSLLGNLIRGLIVSAVQSDDVAVGAVIGMLGTAK